MPDRVKNSRRYKEMLRIRLFEENVLKLFGENKLSGTTHTYIGQEATAVAIMEHVKMSDIIFSNHRCHGHYLAQGGSMDILLGEIMSKEHGMCAGKGGSQHIHEGNFYTNGIQGGIVPNALGMAWAEKIKGTDNIGIVFLGDGTLGQGVVYESFNLAALKKIPLLFVIEDNMYAMSTKNVDGLSGNILLRAKAFGIEAADIESTEVEEISTYCQTAIDYVRNTKNPFCLVIHNCRLAAHSKGDDFRGESELELWRKRDPLIIAANKMTPEEVQECHAEVEKELESALMMGENKGIISLVPNQMVNIIPATESILSCNSRKMLEELREGLDDILKLDEKVLMIGEDICDPYGGAFKVTKGLSTSYPDRVINMPISEHAIAGTAIGLALGGLHPVIEAMFGDFVTLMFDQLLNHAAKYEWIYGNGVKIPFILRLPMGAERGYGPTHSQSLEKYLLGIPGITIFALNPALCVKKTLKRIVDTLCSPTIIIENKKMYSEQMFNIQNNRWKLFFVKEYYQSVISTVEFCLTEECQVDFCIITYGGMLIKSLEAAEDLLTEDEIYVKVISVAQLAPIPIIDIIEAIERTKKIIVVEEGTRTLGWGSEIITSIVEMRKFEHEFARIASMDLPIPNGMVLEKQVIPSKETIIEKVRSMYYGQ